MEYYNQNAAAAAGGFCSGPGDPRISLAALQHNVYSQAALVASPHTLPPPLPHTTPMMLAATNPLASPLQAHQHMTVVTQPSGVTANQQHQQQQQQQQAQGSVVASKPQEPDVNMQQQQQQQQQQATTTVTVEGQGSSFVTPQNPQNVVTKTEPKQPATCAAPSGEQPGTSNNQVAGQGQTVTKVKVKKRSGSSGIKGSKNVLPPVPTLTGDHLETYHAYKEICDSHVRLNSTTICQICDKQFAHWGGLQRHLQSHANFRPFVCKLCGKTFHCQSKMRRHEGTHTGLKPHKCPLCDVRVSRREHLKRHLLTHSETKPFTCSSCGYSETPGQASSNHPHTCPMPWPWKITKPDGTAAAPVPGDPGTFNSAALAPEAQQELIKWKLQREPQDGQQQDQLAKAMGDAEIRELPGGKYGMVAQATKSESGSNEPDVMLRLECDVSSDEEMDEEDKNIIKVHSTEGPCKDPFGTFHKLCMDHMIQKSMSVCLICKRDFQQWMLLRKHLQKHAGCRPYTCVQCGRGFFSKDKMMRHFKTHSGLKPYRCLICGKEVSRAEHLRRHQLTHSEEKPYECVICNYRSRRNDSLRTHLKKAHRLMPEANQNLPLYIRTNYKGGGGEGERPASVAHGSVDATTLAKSIVQGVVGLTVPGATPKKKSKKSAKKKKKATNAATSQENMASSSGVINSMASTVNTNQVLALTKSLSGPQPQQQQQQPEALVPPHPQECPTDLSACAGGGGTTTQNMALTNTVGTRQQSTCLATTNPTYSHTTHEYPKGHNIPPTAAGLQNPVTPISQPPMTPTNNQPPMTPNPQPPMTPTPQPPMTPNPQHAHQVQQEHIVHTSVADHKPLNMFLPPAPLPSHFPPNQPPPIKFSEFSNFATGAVSLATTPGVGRPMFGDGMAGIPNGSQLQMNRLPPMPNTHPMFRPPLNQFYG